MVRIARERVSDLFALAEEEATGPNPELSDRYVRLARRIGMRYNVRLLAEYRELFCRRCSAYWIEGRTVRTRLRSGHRLRRCLRCGSVRRVPVGRARSRASRTPGATQPGELGSAPPVPVDAEDEAGGAGPDDGSEVE